MTMLQYYSARLAYRPLEKDFSPLLYCGKLLHQFICDAYVKVESNRLNYIRTHQSELHVEQYKGLMDYIKNNSDEKFDFNKINLIHYFLFFKRNL